MKHRDGGPFHSPPDKIHRNLHHVSTLNVSVLQEQNLADQYHSFTTLSHTPVKYIQQWSYGVMVWSHFLIWFLSNQ